MLDLPAAGGRHDALPPRQPKACESLAGDTTVRRRGHRPLPQPPAGVRAAAGARRMPHGGRPPPRAPLNTGLLPPRTSARRRHGRGRLRARQHANRLLVPSPFAKRAFMAPVSETRSWRRRGGRVDAPGRDTPRANTLSGRLPPEPPQRLARQRSRFIPPVGRRSSTLDVLPPAGPMVARIGESERRCRSTVTPSAPLTTGALLQFPA